MVIEGKTLIEKRNFLTNKQTNKQTTEEGQLTEKNLNKEGFSLFFSHLLEESIELNDSLGDGGLKRLLLLRST